MKRVSIIISGRVQGVFFRASAKDKASDLGITGWVKNCIDGSVEICAEGSEEKLNELIKWAHQGPEPAHVSKVDVSWAPATGEFKSFEITR